MPLTTIATDNFNRADVNPLATPWNTVTSAWALKILSNVVTGANINGKNVQRETTTLLNDQWAQLTLLTYPKDGTALLGCCVRMKTDDTLNFYALTLQSTTSIEIYKCVAGTNTSLVSDFSVTNANGDVLRLEVVGTKLTAYRNGIFAVSVVDTTFASGTAGIYIDPGTNTTNITVDDWSAGNWIPMIFTGGTMVGRRYV